MSFASPWFLLGLLGIAVPVYLHLYHRKTPVVKNFPSLRLIRISVELVARRQKMRNLLLLLLRIAAVFLVVMALSRPFWGQSASARASATTPAAFVVLLDNSMSMGSTHQGVSVFNTARARALEIIDQMEAGDRATVGLINDPGRLIYSQLTWDKSALQRSVANAPLSMSGTNIASSLLPALKLLAPLNTYRRAVYVVTDMTETAWKPFVERYDLERIDPQIDLVMVPVGGAAPENMAITALECEAPVAMTGREVDLKLRVANYSQRARTARINISINSERKIEQEAELQPESEQEIIISAVFAKPGMTHVMASIQSDALPYDDTRHMALRIFDPCKILVIRPEAPGRGAQAREDLFISFALNPFNRRENNNFVIDSRTTAESRNADPDKYDAVFLVNQQQLEPEFVKRLADYVMGGGNLVTFLGNQVNPEWYNKHLIDDLGGSYLMPARIYQRVGNAVSKNIAYQLTDLDIGHPAFRIFAEEGSGDVTRAHIYEFFQVRPNPSALLLARMSRGLPAIVEEARGQGRSMLVTFAADTSWSTWPMRATWVPFLHQTLISMITGSDLNISNVRPGFPVSATISASEGETITLKKPDGSSSTIKAQVAGSGLVHFSTGDTEQTGYYELYASNSDQLLTAFAVNPPAEESKLDRMGLRQIPRFIALEHDPGHGRSVGEKVSRLRGGYDLSGISLTLLVLIALIECWFANIKPTVLRKAR